MCHEEFRTHYGGKKILSPLGNTAGSISGVHCCSQVCVGADIEPYIV